VATIKRQTSAVRLLVKVRGRGRRPRPLHARSICDTKRRCSCGI